LSPRKEYITMGFAIFCGHDYEGRIYKSCWE